MVNSAKTGRKHEMEFSPQKIRKAVYQRVVNAVKKSELTKILSSSEHRDELML